MDYSYYLIRFAIILFIGLSIFWLWYFIKKLPLLIQYKKEIKKIEEEVRVAMDVKIEEIKEKCVNDISIPSDKLQEVVLDRAKKTCEQIAEEGKEKTRILDDKLKESLK